MFIVIERMYSKLGNKFKIDEQMDMFKKTQKIFRHDMTIVTRDRKLPDK